MSIKKLQPAKRWPKICGFYMWPSPGQSGAAIWSGAALKMQAHRRLPTCFTAQVLTPAGDIAAQMKERFNSLTDEDIRQELEAIANSSGGAIAVRDLELSAAARQEAPAAAQPQAQLIEPKFTGTISRQWRIASFSSLIAGRPHEQEFPQSDEFSAPPASSPAQEAGTMFTLPGGARIGTMLHEILERTDFADPAGAGHAGACAGKACAVRP